MADSDVIRSFLVEAGFRVNQSQMRDFDRSIERVTKNVMALGAELEALAVATVAAVTKIASNFEDLYFTSQRLNSTVENIRGVGFAIQNMGGSAQGARSALEGLAAFMRNNPGGERFIAGLGVGTRQANGELRDTSEILGDLGEQFKRMPYAQARVRANMLGIDDMTLQALLRGDLTRSVDQYRQVARRAGIDQQAASKSAHDFMVNVRTLGSYLQLLGEKYLLALTGPIQRVIGFSTDLDERTKGLSTALTAAFLILAPLAALVGTTAIAVGALSAGLVLLADDFATWREGGKSLIDWSAWSGEINSALAGFKDIESALSSLSIPWNASFGPKAGEAAHRFINAMVDELHMLADAIRVVGFVLKGDWRGAAGAAAQFGKDAFSDDSKPREAGSTPAVRPAVRGNIPRNNPGNLRRPGQAVGFQTYGTLSEGVSAMDRQLLRYQNRDHLNTIQGIINKYAPSSENNTAAYIADVSKRTGFGANQPLDLNDSAVMARLMTAMVAHEQGNKNALGYDQVLGVVQGDRATGGGVTINQKTDIHVNGTDANATGQAVAREQSRVNSDLYRNSVGAVR